MQSLIPTLANYCWLQEMPMYEEDVKDARCEEDASVDFLLTVLGRVLHGGS